MFWKPMCPCRSTSVGITVLPRRSTCFAPAGACRSARRPAQVNWFFSTMKAESSMGALPSPVMSRAPSKTVTSVGGAAEQAAMRIANAVASVRNPPIRMSLLQERGGVALRHEADRNARDFFHRLHVDDGDVIGHRVGDVGRLAVGR